jgi:hypothetical protein
MGNNERRGTEGLYGFVAIQDGTLCLQPSGQPGVPLVSTCTNSASIMHTQRRIHELMRDLQEKILALDRDPPDLVYLISGPGWKEKVQGGFTRQSSLRAALQHDLQMLRVLLRQLPLEAKRIRRFGLQVDARKSSDAFVRDFKQAVEKADSFDDVDPKALSDLKSKSEAALSAWITAVKDNPSPQNMSGLLNELSRNQLAGFDDDSPKSKEAWDVLENTAGKGRQGAEQTFKKNPTSANLRNYLKQAQIDQLFGGEGFSPDLFNLPPGLKRLRPEKQHTVEKNETLSGISSLFYGSPVYWPLIWIQNTTVIGRNPENLTVGSTLKIP